MKLEDYILRQLHILGAVGIGIAFLQVKTSLYKPSSEISVWNVMNFKIPAVSFMRSDWIECSVALPYF